MKAFTRTIELRRVVITGMGTLCPTGNSVEEAWKNVADGVSGIGPITSFDATGLEVQFAGEIKGFDAKERFGYREARRMDRITHLALAATAEALRDARLNMADEDPYQVGCLIGTGVGGLGTLLEQSQLGWERGARVISPLLIPMMLTDSPAGRVAIEYHFRGPNMSISTACATGNNTIGEATEIIRRGTADVMIVGGTEACILPLAVASLNNMTTLSRRNDDPTTASRPFDKSRDGFVLGEGAGILVLESLEHAVNRGAHIYAEVMGYATNDDAFHITAPLENGEAASMAMRRALKDARMGLDDIDYINAHGTATQLNDSSETHAIKNVWGEKAYDIPISSTKSITGHLLGAAGSVEAILSVKSIEAQFVPPTINLHTPDPDCDLNYTPNKGVSHQIDAVMSNAFGFGGHNAVLIFGKYNPEEA